MRCSCIYLSLVKAKLKKDMGNFTTRLVLLLVLAGCLFSMASCKKLVDISDPVDKITSGTAFSSDELAGMAMNGVYTTLMTSGFVKRPITLYASLSSDELLRVNAIAFGPEALLASNRLSLEGIAPDAGFITDDTWNAGYAVIYTANAVIEGIAASTSGDLHEPVRKALTAEAKCIRALCYFYLVNFYGDLPLVSTTEYSDAALIARSNTQQVYEFIIADLKEAEAALPEDYAASGGERIRVNKWAAAALLAKAYLFNGNYPEAVAAAGRVINNSGLYGLERNLDSVFLKNSREAIFQFKQNTSDVRLGNATDDGYTLLPFSLANPAIGYCLSNELLRAFDPSDKRRDRWVDSIVIAAGSGPTARTDTFFYTAKYKTGQYNRVRNAVPTEYYMLLRLAEMYLVRADANARANAGQPAAAVADLNTIRARAGLPALPSSLSGEALLAAVAREWQTEFFCEKGQRWFNLKRTGEARSVLSAIPAKQPWAGDEQLLYPIPPKDINLNPRLKQNPGY